MKRIYLCGHTGSMNRGCEAIVVSVSHILEQLGVDKKHRFLLTYDKKYDEFLKLNERINLISYPKKSFFIRGLSYVLKKFGNNAIFVNKHYFKKLFNNSIKDDIVFQIGGDTYCYSAPLMTYACNEYLKSKNVPNVFFGCSIDTSTVNKTDMCKDINKYSYIVVRESESRKIFEQILNDKSKLYYACDPAFQLPIKEIDLPAGFQKNNTVGINLSPLVFKDYKNTDDIMYQNAYTLIDYILKETDMSVCLIPHVYNVERNEQDSYVLNLIYDKYKNNKRVSIVNKELSCTELKYIISNCRFFIGARTHATIAAYSTGVPTLVLSYSIKSRGIAKDLFGTEDGFLIRWQNVQNKDDIKSIFVSSLLSQEKEIKEKYKVVLPEYKETVINAVAKILESLECKNEK